MDMEIIDTVQAHTLEPGDTIEYIDDEGRRSLQEIKSIEDLGDTIRVQLEDYDDVDLFADGDQSIYGYPAED
jgi:hypothetical protein